MLAPLLGLTCAAPPAQAGPAASDVTATHALLEAEYRFVLAVDRDEAASATAIANADREIGLECHGVLAGAPSDEGEEPPGRGEPKTARARGERARSVEQRETIAAELAQVYVRSLYAPSRPAVEAYAATTGGLTWSDPRIAALVREGANRLQADIASAPAVCADMKAWAASGYRVLSAASKAFLAEREAQASNTSPGASLGTLLKAYEGPAELRLVKLIRAAERRAGLALAKEVQAQSRLQHELGIPESHFEKELKAPVLGRAKGPGGVTYVLRKGVPGSLGEGGCRHAIRIEIQEPASKGRSGFSFGSGSTECLGGHLGWRPSATCGGGSATIEGTVPPSARRVLVRMRDGSERPATVFRISKKEGGPATVYLLGLRSNQHVVAVVYLGADGQVIHESHLRDGFGSCQPPPGGATSGPRFVTLANGTLPDGKPFTIQASVFTFGHHTEFDLMPPLEQGGESEVETGGNTKPKTYEWSISTECPPHQVAVIYGILAPPGDSVEVRTTEGLVPLTKVRLAAHLHSGGPLVYGAFTAVPTELIVLRPDGSTLYTESLAAKAKEEAEFCEGYAEPSS